MSTCDLVIARYQEDLRWLRRVPDAFRKWVYDKGGDAEDGIPLPNIGREAHTYLHHIIEHYDELADVTVFCQGRPFDHVPSFHRVLRDLAAGDVTVDEFLWLGFVIDRDDQHGSLLFQKWSKNPEREPLPMIPFWKHVFDSDVPEHFTFYLGAHFMVTRDCIHKRPRSFYENAMAASVEIHHGAHCFERTWDQVFMVNGIPEAYRDAELPVYFRPIKRLGITWDSAAS